MIQRLRPQQRIRKKEEFDNLLNNGKRVSGTYIVLRTKPHSPQLAKKCYPKIGIIVTRKTNPKATERNRWKRCLREIFRKNQGRINQNLSILIQVRWQTAIPPYRQLEQEFFALLSKVGGGCR